MGCVLRPLIQCRMDFRWILWYKSLQASACTPTFISTLPTYTTTYIHVPTTVWHNNLVQQQPWPIFFTHIPHGTAATGTTTANYFEGSLEALSTLEPPLTIFWLTWTGKQNKIVDIERRRTFFKVHLTSSREENTCWKCLRWHIMFFIFRYEVTWLPVKSGVVRLL